MQLAHYIEDLQEALRADDTEMAVANLLTKYRAELEAEEQKLAPKYDVGEEDWFDGVPV